jgi:hypothetical protein
MRLESVLRVAFLAFCTGLGFVGPGQAGPATDAFAGCIVDNTTGRDRKDLVQWVFAVLAAHPEIKSFAALSEADREQMDRGAASLFERLVTVNCRDQAKAALQADGAVSFRMAFERFGVIASTELMTDQSVQGAMQRFIRLVDQKKLEAALK